jgi:WXG100 family type VII secretion target
MEVDHDGLVRIGQRIDEARHEFTRKAAELDSQLGSLHRQWQGEGGAAFGKLMAEWQQRQHAITLILESFQDSLTTTQGAAARQDSAQAASLSALGTSLDH